jgi:hypothetical protein
MGLFMDNNNIIEAISNTSLVAISSFIFAISFIYMTYRIHKEADLYFDIVSGIALAFFISISGFLNGVAWLAMGNESAGAIIWLLIGLGLEIAKPILIRGGLHSILIKSVVILLQIVSILSATTVIHATLEKDTNKYITYRSQVNSSVDEAPIIRLNKQIKNITLSQELKHLSNADIIKRLTRAKTLQAFATKSDRKRGYRKKLLPDSIYKLTNSCRNTSSPYYLQRNACPDIEWYKTEIQLREHRESLLDKLNILLTEKDNAQNDLYKKDSQVEQNPWMTVANRVLSFLYEDYILVPTNNAELEIMKSQSQVASLLIAFLMGVLIELILHNISYKTFNKPKEVIEYTLWSIIKTKINNNLNSINLQPANLKVKSDIVLDDVSSDINTNIDNYSLSDNKVRLEDVIKNLNEDVILEIYQRTFKKEYATPKGRYIDIAIYLMQECYIELDKYPSQKKVLEMYKQGKGTGVQFNEISSANNFIKPLFTIKKGRSFYWKSKKQLKKDLRLIGLNVV